MEPPRRVGSTETLHGVTLQRAFVVSLLEPPYSWRFIESSPPKGHIGPGQFESPGPSLGVEQPAHGPPDGVQLPPRCGSADGMERSAGRVLSRRHPPPMVAPPHKNQSRGAPQNMKRNIYIYIFCIITYACVYACTSPYI